MTLEELKEFLQDDGNKEVFTELAKGAGFVSEDDIQGLKNKNVELLGKLKKLKDDHSEKLKVLDNIDIDAYNEYINGKESSNNSDAKLSIALKDLDDLQAKYNKVDSDYNNTLKLMAINEALEQSGIDSSHKKILTSAFLGKANVEIENDIRNVTIDDDGLGLPPTEYFKKWIEQDGKAYLKKPENKGGNSSNFSSGNQTITRAEFEKLSGTEKMSLIDKGVQPID